MLARLRVTTAKTQKINKTTGGKPMNDGYKNVEEIIKKVPLEKIEEAYKNDVQHNEILYKTVYNLFTAGEPIYRIKMAYGEIGMMMLIKILTDNNVPVSQELQKEFFYNEFRERREKKNKYIDMGLLFVTFCGFSFIASSILKLLKYFLIK